MLRSLFAGISGLRVNQTMLDVTGNNIANANTTGFKPAPPRSSATPSARCSPRASAANANRGGTNPIQIGLGVQVAATSSNFTQGSAQTTGRPTDLMIQGDGMFVATKGNERALHPGRVPSPSTTPAPWSPRAATGCRATPSTPPGAPTGGLIDVTLDTSGR